MNVDWKLVYAASITVAALTLVAFAFADREKARYDAGYWKLRYDMLMSTTMDDSYDHDFIPSIPKEYWARSDVRVRAYSYLGKWAGKNRPAAVTLNAFWQTEPEAKLREFIETQLKRSGN